MKKILLIEDRFKRQQLFVNETNIKIEEYSEVLDNYSNSEYEELVTQILHDSFSFNKYDYIISHKSVESDSKNNNIAILSKLKEYCIANNKPLILFSGGIAVNYYDNSEYEILELNSKTFYSQNLKLFLDAVQNGNENILMLCYGNDWQKNIISNALEKTNLFINKSREEDIDYNEFSKHIDIRKLDNISYPFYNMEIEGGWVYLKEIIKFRDSLYDSFTPLQTKGFNKDQNILNVLIHNNNIANQKSFENRIKFTPNDDDIDKYISTDIIPELASKEFSVVYIKDNLSLNYLELYGLRVAYHIRLSQELGDKRFVPIVILSDFSSGMLNRFDQLSRILFTKNIFIIENTKKAIEQFNSSGLTNLTADEYSKEFLNHIDIEAPKDYLSHHSIANEWSIYKWADFLNVNSDAIVENKTKIEYMLYFKYLKSLHHSNDLKTKKLKKLSNNGKILFVDDEWDKGWGDILSQLFNKSPDIGFTIPDYVYQDENKFNITTAIKQEVTNSYPDVVILDLRFSKTDHDEFTNIDSFTGIKLLNAIHEINQGIQVVMLTATSKSTILEKLYEYKILGYVKKEHPNDLSIHTADSIDKLVKLVDRGLKKKYLKEIYNIQSNLLALDIIKNVTFSFDGDNKLLELKNTLEMIFETLDSSIPKPFVYGMLTIYKCLEIIADYYIYEKFDRREKRIKAYWVDTSELVGGNGHTSLNNKIKSITWNLRIDSNDIFRLINQIVCSRNYAIHSENIKRDCEDRVVRIPNEDNVMEWFKMLEQVVVQMDMQL